MMFGSKTVNSDHEFLPLGDLIFYDAGAEGLAVRISTVPSPKYGNPHVIGLLLNAEGGKSLLRGLATALQSKFPDDVVAE